MSHKAGSRAPRAGYSVGYCRPPEHTRFKSGTSGNPSGRKGSNQENSASDDSDLSAIERALLHKLDAPSRHGGRGATRLDSLIEGMVQQAEMGDHRALTQVLKWAAGAYGKRDDLAAVERRKTSSKRVVEIAVALRRMKLLEEPAEEEASLQPGEAATYEVDACEDLAGVRPEVLPPREDTPLKPAGSPSLNLPENEGQAVKVGSGGMASGPAISHARPGVPFGQDGRVHYKQGFGHHGRRIVGSNEPLIDPNRKPPGFR